ncbi:MAG: hypothetical protein H7Y33_09025 [Cytophagales bacterium]|nr:hypothetical protein [Rhizobacter sp.]
MVVCGGFKPQGDRTMGNEAVQPSGGAKPTGPAGTVEVKADNVQFHNKIPLTAIRGIDMSVVRTNGAIPQNLADLLTRAYDRPDVAYLTVMMGGAPIGSYSTQLQSLLKDGGSPQLEAYIEYRHMMNVQAAEEAKVDSGGVMSGTEKMQMEAALDDGVAIEVMAAMQHAQGMGSLDSNSQLQTAVTFNGFDVLRDIEFQGLGKDGVSMPKPAEVAALTAADVTALANELLGPNGGSPELRAHRAGLAVDPAKLADFDRGLLVTMGSAMIAVSKSENAEWAKSVGIDTSAVAPGDIDRSSSEIPAKYRGNLLMMLAYVFAKMDERLEKKVVDAINEYNEANVELGAAEKAGDSHEALSKSVQGMGIMLGANMSMYENNSKTYASLSEKTSSALNALWR